MRFHGGAMICLAMSLVVLACGKSEPSGDRAAAAAPTSGGSAALPDKRGELTKLLAGTKPAPLAALTKVRLGMPRDEAMAAAPEFFAEPGDPRTLVATDLVAALYIDGDSELVEGLLLVAGFDMRPQLVAAWGEPAYRYDHTFTKDTYRDDGARSLWFDATSGWAAIGESTGLGYSLQFVPAQSFSALLGTAKDRLAFEGGRTLIGRSREEICAEFPIDCAKRLAAAKSMRARKPQASQQIEEDEKRPFTLDLPLTEWSADPPTVRLEWNGNTVRGYRVSFRTTRPGSRDAMLEAVKQHWGEPKLHDDLWVLHEEPLVYLSDDTPKWETVAIYVGLPLDE